MSLPCPVGLVPLESSASCCHKLSVNYVILRIFKNVLRKAKYVSAIQDPATAQAKFIPFGRGAFLDLTVSLMLHGFLYRYMYQVQALHPDFGFGNTEN